MTLKPNIWDWADPAPCQRHWSQRRHWPKAVARRDIATASCWPNRIVSA